MALDPRIDIRWRLKLVYIAMFLFAIAILGKAISIGIVNREKWLKVSEKSNYRLNDINPIRGNIMSWDGKPLVVSVPMYDVNIYFRNFKIDEKTFNDKLDSLSLMLAELSKGKVSKSEFKSQLRTAFYKKKKKKYDYIRIAEKISYQELKAIKKFPIIREGLNKVGYDVITTYQRQMPYGLLARKTLGMESEKYDSAEARKYKDKYTVKKGFGLEAFYDKELTGKPGRQLYQVMSQGHLKPLESELNIEPLSGKDVITSIDINIQDVAEQELAKQLRLHQADAGCVVVMEVKTGFIKAIANLKRSAIKTDTSYNESYNYAVSYQEPPGSTFKLASYLAGIDDGYLKPSDSIDTKGGVVDFFGKKVTDSRKGGYGVITVKKAFEESSNTAVTQLIYRHYNKNPQKFIDKVKSFGFANPTGIDLVGEPSPFIKNTTHKNWSKLSLPWISYGYETKISPLQILNFYNAVANGGKLMKPQLVKEIRYRGETIKKYDPIVLNPAICKPSSIEAVMPMLKGVVESGTAKNLKNPFYSIAGKTGTTRLDSLNSKGEKVKSKYIASFAGFFPADAPKYSCIVVVYNPSEKGFYGNVVAGSVFKRVSDKLYAIDPEMHSSAQLLLAENKSEPKTVAGRGEDFQIVASKMNLNYNDGFDGSEWVKLTTAMDELKINPKKTIEGKTPDVRGMNFRDALFLLENMGYRVKANGKGIVTGQSIEPGVQIIRNQLIELDLS
jgi:cell division protein FtsI (penicillin-binding protein 3)